MAAAAPDQGVVAKSEDADEIFVAQLVKWRSSGSSIGGGWGLRI